MDLSRTGIRTIILSTGAAGPSSGAWKPMGSAFARFGLRCVRATSIGTSNFAVSLRGALSTVNTTGAAVGAIGAYTPTTLIAYTQANVGKIKLSTALVPASFVKAVVATMTTAANRKLRIEVVCIP